MLQELSGALERQFQLPAALVRGPAWVLPPGIACEPMSAQQRSMRTGLLELKMCRNATHGLLVAEYSNATERVTLLRIGGPHPQSAIFQRSAAGRQPANTRSRWVAAFRTCTPGLYTVHVLFVTLNPWGQGDLGFMKQCHIHHTPEAVLMRNASFAVGEGAAASALSDASRVMCQACLWSWPVKTPRLGGACTFLQLCARTAPIPIRDAEAIRPAALAQPGTCRGKELVARDAAGQPAALPSWRLAHAQPGQPDRRKQSLRLRRRCDAGDKIGV